MKAYYIIPFLILTAIGCQKDWLESKSDSRLVVPSTIEDFQALLDNTTVMNRTNLGGGTGNPAEFSEIGTDNYYLSNDVWNALSGDFLYGKNAYIFAKDIFEGQINNRQWTVPYQRIFYANNALEGIDKIIPSEKERSAWNNVKGSALFIRAYNHWWLSQLFSKPYDSITSLIDLGIPLKLSADINDKITRSTVEANYQSIINDLEASIPLLPENTSILTRPSQKSALVLVARVYLSMGKYKDALLFVNKAFAMGLQLINFNSFNASSTYPVPQYNNEVLFQDRASLTAVFIASKCRVDTMLLKAYDNMDLRTNIYFSVQNGYKSFKGSYDGSNQFWSGIASDEAYLIKAECEIRMGNGQLGIVMLDSLLINRYKTNTYIPYNYSDQASALVKVLVERRKELCFRGLRWTDLRRLNKEGMDIVVKRWLNGNEYLLNPNSPNYLYPIPDDVISYNHMEQNERL